MTGMKEKLLFMIKDAAESNSDTWVSNVTSEGICIGVEDKGKQVVFEIKVKELMRLK